MKNYKNYLIALLAGLLVLTLTTQPSIGASSSSTKAIEYDRCLDLFIAAGRINQGSVTAKQLSSTMDFIISQCKKYQP